MKGYMMIRLLLLISMAMLATTGHAGIWSYKWPDGSTSYHNNKPTTKGLNAANLKSLTDAQAEAVVKASPTLLTPKSELTKALLPGATAPVVPTPAPALTRADIERLAATYGMTYPVPITREFIEAEAGKLGMVYPSTPAATEPDVVLLQRVYVNANAPCVALKADLIKSLGGKYYQANISLWDTTKPIALGLGCN